MKTNLDVDGLGVRVDNKKNGEVWFCLTDIAKLRGDSPGDIIKNWMRTRPTIKFLGLWESLNNNADFKLVEFDQFKNAAGDNAFTMSPKKWIDGVGAIGMRSASGRYGGTWARRQIALEFASWVDPSFKLYLISEFERLKGNEVEKLNWEIKRQIASDNHHIHTDSIRRNLVPANQINKRGEGIFHASEVDMLNQIVFGIGAKEWRVKNSKKPVGKNMRDYATKEELFLLSNLEAINSAYIEDGLDQVTRFHRLVGVCGYQRELIKKRGLKVLPKNV